MKEKIKLGIPIENEATGETNVILRTNEIRIIEEAFEEIKKLHSIIKEVRETLINSKEYKMTKEMSLTSKMSVLIELLEILDKEEV